MEQTTAQSKKAQQAGILVESLQKHFVTGLQQVASSMGDEAATTFTASSWLRDKGIHGGGCRFGVGDTSLFNRASVNVSQVHYDDVPTKKLGSATALSTIIHPQNPLAPSVHIHISWTEMRDGSGYWRLMADLNPSIENKSDTQAFEESLKNSTSIHYEKGVQQAGKYFYIPVLNRHRGVSHFYLENYKTDDWQQDYEFAKHFGTNIIDSYLGILKQAVQRAPKDANADKAAQLAYHTVYLFQVLTLDRGTTSGLLIHSDNDVGIMGSLPAYVDKDLLITWISKMPTPQDNLLRKITESLPDSKPAEVTIEAKKALAEAVRKHYQQHPDALKLQASGDIIPPTVDNHQAQQRTL